MASKRIVIHFPRRLVSEPVVSNLVKHYGLDFNILKASVTPREEGLLVLEVSGAEEALAQGEGYLRGLGLTVQPLSEDIVRNTSRCTHCGACTPVCPTGALALERVTMEVRFDSDKCIGCQMCVPACPTRAMEVHF